MNNFVMKFKKSLVSGLIRRMSKEVTEDPVFADRLCLLCTLYLEGTFNFREFRQQVCTLYMVRKLYQENGA
jgi:hypothetical protein